MDTIKEFGYKFVQHLSIKLQGDDFDEIRILIKYKIF